MAKHAHELHNLVIIPTLKYLGADSTDAEGLLVACALLAGHYRIDDERLGIYQISPEQHRQIWDEHLAFYPDVASEIRALASQRWFLENPDRELITNLAYATAIAWMLFSISGLDLPCATDIEAQTLVWLKILAPKPLSPSELSEAIDWLSGRLRKIGLPQESKA